MTPYDDLRARFESLATEELASLLRRHDTEEWRPEVFDVVRSILVRRGVFGVAPESDQAEGALSDPAGEGDLLSTDGMELVASGLDLSEADEADKALCTAAIPVQLVPDGVYFSVYIPIGEAARSIEVLRAAGVLSATPVPDAITTTGGPCPACGGHVEAGLDACPGCGLAV